GVKTQYETVSILFTSPLQKGKLDDFVTISPAANIYLNQAGKSLRVTGFFDPDTQYTITISGTVQDRWGSPLGQPYSLTFITDALDSRLVAPSYLGSGVLFVNPADPVISVQAVNIDNVDLEVGEIALDTFIELRQTSGSDAYNYFLPDSIDSWNAKLAGKKNKNQIARVSLTRRGAPLSPGIYWVSMQSDEITNQYYTSFNKMLAVVSHVNLVYKVSGTEVLVWAVDTRDNKPVVGERVNIYNDRGAVLAGGQTDAEGIFQAEMATPLENVYDRTYVQLSSSGEEYFSLATSEWGKGSNGWDFGYLVNNSPPWGKVYVYTDRPIYRPGQTVNFRAVARQAYNGRYSPYAESTLSLKVEDQFGSQIGLFDLPLSGYGTAHSSFVLPAEAVPGIYWLSGGENYSQGSVSFRVAEYRKPEIDLTAAFRQDEIIAGNSLAAEIEARYFFDAPAGGQEITWNLYRKNSYFYLPNYTVGKSSTDWFFPMYFPENDLGSFIESGVGRTDQQGGFSLDLQTESSDEIEVYTLEATIQDESGYPVSSRVSAAVYPSDFVIGLQRELWVGQAGTENGVAVLTADWKGRPAGSKRLKASFSRIDWETDVDPFGYTVFEPVYELLDTQEITTNAQGESRVGFTPKQPGTYMVELSGGGAVSQLLLWIGGPGQAVWPNSNDNQIQLLADQQAYRPGDTAEIFIPNSLQPGALALVTIERGIVLQRQVIRIDGSSLTLPVNLSDQETPNVYVAVSLVGE
ncbi:MAG: MG2 domain-containing protein, partial [Anaerolineae bacterium]|nr:MG2 domain-containing protein [Anaerolineae bacterium]